MKLYKRSPVIVVNLHGFRPLQEGVIDKIHWKTGQAFVRFPDSYGQLYHLSDLRHPKDVDIESLKTLLVKVQAEEAEKRKAFEEERYREALIEYRKARAFPVPTYHRQLRGSRIEFGPMTTPKNGGEPFIPSFIEIYNDNNWKDNRIPRVEINWSALGAVTPEEAEQFAFALLKAVDEAKTLRAEREAQTPAPVPQD